MIGQTISHYKILEKLGEGGMGVVYKAEDVKLKRAVAVKFLPHHLTSTEEEQARFMQEAQAAATLNHPNVCTIHAIEEAEEKQFIVMEYVDGVTLREKIGAGAPARTGEPGGHRDLPLPMKDAISYGVQIGEALQEAHSKGIVHRDIKADNIMVNAKNQVKVMDFGLAKLKGSLKLTRSSSTVGTLSYMAPEQIQGGEVDARSDIFSFGIVLYEMLTGRTPFRGEHDAAMMYSILNEEPEPADKLRSDISPELLHILSRAIEKDPEDRYQTAHEMVIDLRRLKKESSRVSRAPLAAMPPSVEPAKMPERPRRRQVAVGAAIAVLLVLGVVGYILFLQPSREVSGGITVAVADFINETGENELNGLSGMLITALEQSRRLTVLPRSRMFDILKQMGNADVDQIDESTGRQICSYAHINALAVASIRKFGRLYTIDLKMLDPVKNEYLFTAKVDGEGQESVPSMIDQLSEKTRVGLNEKVTEIEITSQSVAQVTTTNLEAYQHFFIGNQLIGKLKFKEAGEELKKAVALDSTFALAYYRLAYARAWMSEPNAKGPIQAALKYISKAPKKEQLLIRAEAEVIDGDIDEAFAIYQQVLKEYPDEKEALYNFGDYSHHRGDFQSAIRYLAKVLELDPTFDRAYEHIIWTYASLGQYDTMTKFAKDYVAKAPSEEAYELLGAAYRLQGEYTTAFETLQKGVELYPQSVELVIETGQTHIAQGNSDKAEEQFSKLLDKGRKPTERSTGYKSMASLSAYLGQYRKAIEFLQKAIDIDETVRDSTDLALCYAEKAYWFARAWGNGVEAKKAIAKSNEYKEAANLYVYGSLIEAYVILGDFLEASEIATKNISSALPLYRDRVKAANRMANKQYKEAVQEYTSLLQKENYFVKPTDELSIARCYFELGQYDRAIEALRPIARTFAEGFETDLDVYPRSLYWLGKTFEKKGDREEAMRHFERLLKLWKDADRDLPELIDAEERLAALKVTTYN